MTRGQRRRRLSFSWWQQLLLTLLPLVLVTWFFGKSEPLLPELAMPLFIAGVASMFVTLRTFGPYKHGLINLQKPSILRKNQQPGMSWRVRVSVPCWRRACPRIATLAVFVGLEGVPLLLLVLSTLVLFYLYRIPRQVG